MRVDRDIAFCAVMAFQISSCVMYFGTSHRPTKALMTSPMRRATNIRMEYHQNSPRRA